MSGVDICAGDWWGVGDRGNGKLRRVLKTRKSDENRATRRGFSFLLNAVFLNLSDSTGFRGRPLADVEEEDFWEMISPDVQNSPKSV